MPCSRAKTSIVTSGSRPSRSRIVSARAKYTSAESPDRISCDGRVRVSPISPVRSRLRLVPRLGLGGAEVAASVPYASGPETRSVAASGARGGPESPVREPFRRSPGRPGLRGPRPAGQGVGFLDGDAAGDGNPAVRCRRGDSPNSPSRSAGGAPRPPSRAAQAKPAAAASASVPPDRPAGPGRGPSNPPPAAPAATSLPAGAAGADRERPRRP